VFLVNPEKKDREAVQAFLKALGSEEFWLYPHA
jgi:hypothetical protein